MRKGIVIILAVAIIGALGIYSKSRPSAAHTTSSDSTSVQSSSTLAPAVDDSNSTPDQSISYKDGTYTGDNASTVYGDVRIAVVVSGGKIIDVNFLRMPDDRGHTQEVTDFAEPLLKQETLRKQSAHIDFVSGATQTSEGYQQSLQSALDMAV
jgi:uncharacterized protein with FMN-binding domain